MPASVVGRDAELAVVQQFLSGVPEGASALVLEGEAGMGKTTLWRAAVEDARGRGLRVLQAQPAESETALTFSGTADLLQPVLDEVIGELPAPQRKALRSALLLESDAAGALPDSRAIGVAVLGVLRALAATGATVIAVDDVQWLDSASAGALAFAARRLDDAPVGLLLARRSGVESTLVVELLRSGSHSRIAASELGPLSNRELHAVLRQHLGTTLPQPLLVEVHHASGGNPFFALELVRMLQRSGVSVEAGQPLPLPDSLRELVRGRLLALPAESREFLLAVAAHAHPTLSITEAASGVDRESGLTPALDARVVELDRDRIRFTHPLLAAGAYEIADPLRRREVHARLAELLDDPEARAWQLAAWAETPDEAVAAALDDAARGARARGAPRPAALLLERARDLTPDDDLRLRRDIEAAFLHFEAGDSLRAEAQLEALVSRLGPGPTRARALVRLARVRSYEAQGEAVELFLRAIDEAGSDSETLAAAHEGVAACYFRLRDRLEEAVEHAEAAAQIALSIGDEALAGEATGTKLIAETLLGGTTTEHTAQRARELQDRCEDRRILAQPLLACAVHAWWTDEFAEARGQLLELLERARELGDESSLPYVLVLLGRIEGQLGLYASADERARDGKEAAEQSGQRTLYAYNLALEALVAAQLGAVERARVAGMRALELVPETGGRPPEHLAREALGHLELAAGAPEPAIAMLVPAVEYAREKGIREPGALRLPVDLVEAWLEVGRCEEATELLDWHEGNARGLERASSLANCARCRGLLAAQAGDLDAALVAFEAALTLHAKVELPLDRGRTLLALGATQRRLKRRREARATLEEALGVFERIGAGLWAERARAELKRISGRAATPGALTPAEERVAALVAEGRTNREVAAALFVSERTVEGHLSRIFGKLGVRHRAEIASVLALTQTQGSPSPNTGGSPVSAESSAP